MDVAIRKDVQGAEEVEVLPMGDGKSVQIMGSTSRRVRWISLREYSERYRKIGEIKPWESKSSFDYGLDRTKLEDDGKTLEEIGREAGIL